MLSLSVFFSKYNNYCQNCFLDTATVTQVFLQLDNYLTNEGFFRFHLNYKLFFLCFFFFCFLFFVVVVFVFFWIYEKDNNAQRTYNYNCIHSIL